jgi:cytochrome P450
MTTDRDALNPFSTGPRGCIGKKYPLLLPFYPLQKIITDGGVASLAYNEMRSVIARMIWHFDMELVNEDQNWTDQNVYLMWEKPPLMVKLSHSEMK